MSHVCLDRLDIQFTDTLVRAGELDEEFVYACLNMLDIKDNRYLPHNILRHVVHDFRNVSLVAEDMHLAYFRFDLVQRQVLCQRLADGIEGRGRYLLDRHINPCHRLFGDVTEVHLGAVIGNPRPAYGQGSLVAMRYFACFNAH